MTLRIRADSKRDNASCASKRGFSVPPVSEGRLFFCVFKSACEYNNRKCTKNCKERISHVPNER